MLSIYKDTKYASLDDMMSRHHLHYNAPPSYYQPFEEPLTLVPMKFEPTDLYRLFLITLEAKGGGYVQHFVVVIQRDASYYSMGFGIGPNDEYVLNSPDPYLKKISHLEKYKAGALNAFTPLGEYTENLNGLVSTYTLGGYIQYKGIVGFFAGTEVKKQYSVFSNTCLSGFESVFPVPVDKLNFLERLCVYHALGRGKNKSHCMKSKRNRNRKLRKTRRGGYRQYLSNVGWSTGFQADHTFNTPSASRTTTNYV
jgi:hypothetical protein